MRGRVGLRPEAWMSAGMAARVDSASNGRVEQQKKPGYAGIHPLAGKNDPSDRKVLESPHDETGAGGALVCALAGD
ncbi:hypothetical protein Acidovoranil_19230 [Acidovorax sp. FG27]